MREVDKKVGKDGDEECGEFRNDAIGGECRPVADIEETARTWGTMSSVPEGSVTRVYPLRQAF